MSAAGGVTPLQGWGQRRLKPNEVDSGSTPRREFEHPRICYRDLLPGSRCTLFVRAHRLAAGRLQGTARIGGRRGLPKVVYNGLQTGWKLPHLWGGAGASECSPLPEGTASIPGENAKLAEVGFG